MASESQTGGVTGVGHGRDAMTDAEGLWLEPQRSDYRE